jgi:7-carboxy-7-deazaguanine synthase
MSRLKVTEIFHSIQGESTLAGERFTFVRLTGCPLRCTYCDTTYSYTGGQWMEVSEIVATVQSHGTRWVCLTGGEPLVQKNSLELVQALRALDIGVTIETDGEEDVAPYVGLARLIMDVKTPSSGEKAERCFKNFEHLKRDDEIKFVIGDDADYTWSVGQCREYRLTERFTVLFSPVHGNMDLKTLAEKIIADRLNVRLQTQMHKYIWGENVKGV